MDERDNLDSSIVQSRHEKGGRDGGVDLVDDINLGDWIGFTPREGNNLPHGRPNPIDGTIDVCNYTLFGFFSTERKLDYPAISISITKVFPRRTQHVLPLSEKACPLNGCI